MEISVWVIMRLREFLHRGGKENPGGDYLHLHKAKNATELKDLLLFHPINFHLMHRNETWDAEGQDIWCVQ